MISRTNGGLVASVASLYLRLRLCLCARRGGRRLFGLLGGAALGGGKPRGQLLGVRGVVVQALAEDEVDPPTLANGDDASADSDVGIYGVRVVANASIQIMGARNRKAKHDRDKK